MSDMVQRRRERRRKTARAARLLALVAVIVGIPAFLLLPALVKSRECARKATCMSQLKQIGLGMKQYALDNAETMPWDCADSTNAFRSLGLLHRACVPDIEIFRCPSSKDVPMDPFSSHVRGYGSPFASSACKEGLSYSYSHNQGKSWTEEA